MAALGRVNGRLWRSTKVYVGIRIEPVAMGVAVEPAVPRDYLWPTCQ